MTTGLLPCENMIKAHLISDTVFPTLVPFFFFHVFTHTQQHMLNLNKTSTSKQFSSANSSNTKKQGTPVTYYVEKGILLSGSTVEESRTLQ